MNRLINDIEYRAWRYFKDHTNQGKTSKGYGLTVDHSKNPGVASIAATGFMLSSILIGAHRGYLSESEAIMMVRGTFETILRADHDKGFLSHFLDMDTAQRHRLSEYSTIDTALMLNGVITVSSAFKDPLIQEMAKAIIERIDWGAFIFFDHGKPLLRMAYNPDRGGAYVIGEPGFIHRWDMTAEQLMMYVMIGGSRFKEHAKALYEAFEKPLGRYGDEIFVHSPGNTLFTYQFPLAWLDLKHIDDPAGINWHDNASAAIRAHRALSIDLSTQYRTFSKHRFGFNASDTPRGYRVFFGLPNVTGKPITDGTVAPFGIVSSLPFEPVIALDAIKDLMTIDGLYGPYGFMDAFNGEQGMWISDKIISIDKGLELLMASAASHDIVRSAYMKHPIIKEGLDVIGFKEHHPKR